jgi:hypothetical protein
LIATRRPLFGVDLNPALEFPLWTSLDDVSVSFRVEVREPAASGD